VASELISEEELLATVTQMAQLQGWMVYHTRDSRRSQTGFPDLVLVRPPVVWFVELLIEASYLMCAFHWFKLPRRLRDAVWAAYRPGQEITLDPSPEWLKAAEEARQWVAEREGRRPPTLKPAEEETGG
jgi:hypothetical protein